MALRRPAFIKLLAPLIAFAVTALAIASLDQSSDPARVVNAGETVGSDSPDALASLGNAHLQKARETADPSYYERAGIAFRRALRDDSRNAGALTGMGSLALARHDFRAALRYGEQALASAPGVARIHGVIVDAQIELGRYGDAERSLQRMVDLKPNLSSYARVSYFRELRGDLGGALEAMRLAVSAGGDGAENVAYVQTLLGNLQLERGNVAAAERSYRTALARFSRYGPAAAGLARTAAARGDLGLAIQRYRQLATRLPLPEYVVALAEAELAAGRTAAARESIALVRAEQGLLASNGVNTDVELALFEANHGNAHSAVTLARRAWAAAPSVRSADALGWALTRAGDPAAGLDWARRALKLGSRDPSFLYHAGIGARAAGRPALARAYLARSLRDNPRFSPLFSPLYGPRAERALAELR